MSSLGSIRSATASVSTEKEANDEAWMTMWCSSNWGELLQPTPLSITLLGSVLIIASRTKDFSLLTTPPDVPSFEWKHVRAPDSFKTCLMHLVGDGHSAFETAHKNMTAIQDYSGKMRETISTVVQLLNDASSEQIETHLPRALQGLRTLALRCQRDAASCEGGFKDLADLTQELVLACTYKAGSSEQAIEAHALVLAILEEEKKGTAERIKLAEDTLKSSKDSLWAATEQFHDATRSMPSGWDHVGMGVVESLNSMVVSAFSATISAATMKHQMSSVVGGNKHVAPGTDTAPHAPAPGAIPTATPNGPSISDPGTPLVQPVLAQANALLTLLTGTQPDTADWTKINDKGGRFVQSTLIEQKIKLDATKPMSQSLGASINILLTVADAIIVDAMSGGNNAAVPGYKTTTNQQITQLQALSQTAALLLQTPGTIAGLAPVPIPPAQPSSDKAAEIAVSNAKFRVDLTKQVLESVGKAFMDTSQERQKQQKEITQTIADMTALKLTDMNLMEMIPVLRKSIATFSQLRAQFSQLVQLFGSVASLISEVTAPSVAHLAFTLEATRDLVLGGVTLKAFDKDRMYQQCMTALKVAMLSTKITGAYIEVSNDYIMPAQRKVRRMLDFPPPGDAPGAQAAYIKLLEAEQAQLRKDSEAQSASIGERIAADQASFGTLISSRSAKIIGALRNTYPEVTAPPPQHLAQVTDNYVKDTVARQQKDANLALTTAFNNLM